MLQLYSALLKVNNNHIFSIDLIEIFPLLNNKDLQAPNKLITTDITEIKSIVFFENKNLLIAGFQSGNLGTWELSQNNTFNFQSLEKRHDEVITFYFIFNFFRE